MTLDVAIGHQIGALTLDVTFAAAPGLTALFGHSGAGKTTIVDIIAGLVTADRARITVDGTTLVDTDAAIDLPPHRRHLGYVFQEPRLFPHLSVRGNLAYGRWFQQVRAGSGEFERTVDLLGLQPLLERRPEKLSGGEKQRVAIGRALLASPRLLLMDEPLSSLDDGLKQDILPFIERLRDESQLPIVYVSHSIAEISRLAQTIVVLSEGKVAASGVAADVMQRIDLSDLAGGAEAGALIEAQVVAHDRAWDLTALRSRAGEWQVPRLDATPGTRIRMRVRSRDVMLSLRRPVDISALNVISATVTEIGASHGAMVEIRLDCNGEALIARLTRSSVARLELTPGTSVFALVKSVAIERRDLGRGDTIAPRKR